MGMDFASNFRLKFFPTETEKLQNAHNALQNNVDSTKKSRDEMEFTIWNIKKQIKQKSEKSLDYSKETEELSGVLKRRVYITQTLNMLNNLQLRIMSKISTLATVDAMRTMTEITLNGAISPQELMMNLEIFKQTSAMDNYVSEIIQNTMDDALLSISNQSSDVDIETPTVDELVKQELQDTMNEILHSKSKKMNVLDLPTPIPS